MTQRDEVAALGVRAQACGDVVGGRSVHWRVTAEHQVGTHEDVVTHPACRQQFG
jgi:hypothetical protein